LIHLIPEQCCVDLHRMTPKARYQFMIEPEQRDALRRIKESEGIPEAEQIRRAINEWLERREGTHKKAERKRADTRKRP
jgi:hypothetical protein